MLIRCHSRSLHVPACPCPACWCRPTGGLRRTMADRRSPSPPRPRPSRVARETWAFVIKAGRPAPCGRRCRSRRSPRASESRTLPWQVPRPPTHPPLPLCSTAFYPSAPALPIFLAQILLIGFANLAAHSVATQLHPVVTTTLISLKPFGRRSVLKCDARIRPWRRLSSLFFPLLPHFISPAFVRSLPHTNTHLSTHTVWAGASCERRCVAGGGTGRRGDGGHSWGSVRGAVARLWGQVRRVEGRGLVKVGA